MFSTRWRLLRVKDTVQQHPLAAEPMQYKNGGSLKWQSYGLFCFELVTVYSIFKSRS